MNLKGRVLIVAGSDSGGGAGIQADIKAVTALGGFAMTAVTALTAQNTEGVHGIHAVPPAFVQQQMRVVLADLGADCIKLGMLHSAGMIDAVADILENEGRGIPVVADPVMVAKGGQALLQDAALETLRRRILPLATLVTPNIPEAALLTGLTLGDIDSRRAAGEKLLDLGAHAALVKGGHADEPTVTDLLVTARRAVPYSGARIATAHTHGTGCTLASAIAAGLAQRMPLADAVNRARAYVLEAIRTAPGFGKGHGPLNHAVTVRPFDATMIG